jgi:hypothetical protein
VAVKSHAPFAFRDKVKLSHIPFLLVNISIFRVVLEDARHESKADFVGKPSVKFFTSFEKGCECWSLEDVFKHKLTHEVLSNFRGNGVEIFLVRKQCRDAVSLPKILKVFFYLHDEFMRDLLTDVESLIAYTRNSYKPLS